MCALENPKSDNSSWSKARDSLQALVQTGSPTPDQVMNAVEALQALRAKLSSMNQERVALLEHARSCQTVAKAALAHTQRVDSEIIQAKMEAGELLTVRDSLARDLTRAKRTLSRLDAVGDEDNVDVPMLKRTVEGEMERMREAEKGLLDVMEQITSMKNRRVELTEKVKMAQEEW